MRSTDRALAKAALVGGFWAAQGLAVYLFGAAWFTAASEVSPTTNPWGRFTLEDYCRTLTSRDYTIGATVAIVLITALQAVFVMPVRRPTPAAARGWPISASLAAAGLFIAALIGGASFAVLYMLEFGGVDLGPLSSGLTFNYFLLGSLLVSWAIATPLLIVFCRRRPREALLSRVASLVFLGTLVEAAAIIPLDVLVRRKETCYCAAGTFWALTICGGVGVVVLGPAIFLPLLARRRKRWYAGRCEVCGYDMTGCPRADRCPECGAGWRA